MIMMNSERLNMTLHNTDWPWITDPAIDFLEEYLKPDMHILEFGCGSSTVYFSKKCNNVISIEHQSHYYEEAKNKCGNNVALHLLQLPYYSYCNLLKDNHFDLVLVDGRNRKRCVWESMRIVKPGGYIMLDNSEREYYSQVFEFLKDWECTNGKQVEPNRTEFCYGNFTTSWRRKPNG